MARGAGIRILRRRIRERRWNRRGRMMAAAAKNRQQRRNQIRVKSNDGSEAGARRSEDMKKSSRRGREKRVARAGHLGNLACCVTPARAARSPDPTLCPHFERALGPSFPELRSRLCPGNSRAQSDLVSTSCARLRNRFLAFTTRDSFRQAPRGERHRNFVAESAPCSTTPSTTRVWPSSP